MQGKNQKQPGELTPRQEGLPGSLVNEYIQKLSQAKAFASGGDIIADERYENYFHAAMTLFRYANGKQIKKAVAKYWLQLLDFVAPAAGLEPATL